MTDTRAARPQPEPGTRPMVLADRVCKSFGALQVLKGVSLEVQAGEVACLIGPSGSGKSTFLRCVNHLGRSTPDASWSTASRSVTASAAASSTR